MMLFVEPADITIALDVVSFGGFVDDVDFIPHLNFDK